jgi:Fe-S-cluster-containing dehydrogenase component
VISNYGFEDGTGAYYIAIDSGKCAICEEKPCVDNCPTGVLGKEADDFDDIVAIVKEEFRHQIQIACTECHVAGLPLPCVGSCRREAIRHSW